MNYLMQYLQGYEHSLINAFIGAKTTFQREI